MACNSTSCQSGCYRSEEQETEPQEQKHDLTSRGVIGVNGHQNLCMKCKTNPPICGGSGDTGDDGRFCRDCFRSNLYGKFKHAVSSNAMITPSDKVLVAFSGGASSRVALQFVHEMQQKAQKNYDASKDRSLPVFGVGIALIDESAISSVPSEEIETAIEEIRSIVSNAAPPAKEFHVFPIENVFSSDSIDGKNRVKKLIDAVSDATGREDLITHLRMLSLQKVASHNGYNRILLGTCTSRIACHVITATVKGKGYSLPADIQHVDCRWKVPVVLPLRDCFSRELNMLCRLDGLKSVKLFKDSGSGINGLVSSFVKLLQEENSSRECTIVRTAGKLIPFHFNKIPEIMDSNVPLATRRRQKRLNSKPNDSISSESFCPICNSPLKISDSANLKQPESYQNSHSLNDSCCSSCQFQIVPNDSSSAEHFLSLLPGPMVARAGYSSNGDVGSLSNQIQDCLLSDCEDEV